MRQAIVLEAERLFYSNGRLYLIDYDTLHGIIDGKFAIVELISYASFCEVVRTRVGFDVVSGNIK